MNAKQLRALGCWGQQGGLLSESEVDLLMDLVRGLRPGLPLIGLEIGHYTGLSTCALVTALRTRDNPKWELDTVDCYQDAGDRVEDGRERFVANRKEYFEDKRLHAFDHSSQEIHGELCCDFVFYDGDHAAEQRRFTELAIYSPDVELFVFDDRDFPVPVACCELLRESGWTDESPGLLRWSGDKTDPRTMTLGVFRRPQ